MEKKSLSGGKLVLLMVAVYLALFLAGKYNDRLLYIVSRMAFIRTEEPGEEYTRKDYGLVLRIEDSLLILLNNDRQGVSYRIDENTEIKYPDGIQPGDTVRVYSTVHEGEMEPYLAQGITVYSTGEVQRPGGELLLETGVIRGTGG